MYVSHSASWFNSLLKIDKCKDISSFGWDIFPKHFWRQSWDVVHYFQIILIFLCLSMCYLAHFFTEITQILGYLRFWIRYISEIFGRHSWDVGTLFSNSSEFLVCLSVCLFAYFLTEIRQSGFSSSEWYIFLDFFGDLPEVLVHCIQNIQISLYFCQSGSWHTSSMKSNKFRNIWSSWWYIFLNICGPIPWMLIQLFQIFLIF